MQVVVSDWEGWREEARGLLERGVAPQEVFWVDGRQGSEGGADASGGMQLDLLAGSEGGSGAGGSGVSGSVGKAGGFRVSREFVRLGQGVAMHRSGRQWQVLYRVLWRMVRGGERGLLGDAADGDVRALAKMGKEIGRDIHKMRAFVRFREVVVEEGEEGEEGVFVAWFEPFHFIVRANAPFFRKRFAGMRWSILTPDECVHWNGEGLRFSPGMEKSAVPEADDVFEDFWRSYYKSTFNPARVKVKMMQSEMPKKYWKHLPEAEVIADLLAQADGRVRGFMKE